MSTSAPAVPSTIFPPQYSFPPFFTRQPNVTTYSHQRTLWASLILSYYRHARKFRIRLPDAFEEAPFVNSELNRKLPPKDALEILLSMEKAGDVEFLDKPKSKDIPTTFSGEVLLWWKKPEEWGSEIARWVDETGQKGSVLTLWEIANGDATVGMEFHGLEPGVVRKALDTLVKKGVAQIFSVNDEAGVKFF